MGAATASPLASLCYSHHSKTTLLFSSSSSTLSFSSPRNPISRFHALIPQLGLRSLSTWSGLKHLGVASRRYFVQREKKGRCRGRVVHASLFGVGAPEALVIGVVALLVFGPKGLAEVARNLGKTLRAFQPTIRELQDVSREFKSTLEREIGLDEVAPTTNYKSTSYMNNNQQAVVDPNGKPTDVAYSSEELLKVTEEQLAAAATNPQTKPSTPSEQAQVALTTSEAAVTTSTEVTATSAAPENASQMQSSEKADNER
ncbi:sec-independent protein translocase protein TATB, chloroplastic [Typha latifolia]|uniref:sec-independent protein translocase protein TATB, chloroplastic n=1 Tax=Typha latifolia TaxID=4733 RepID=UPI003C2C2C9E